MMGIGVRDCAATDLSAVADILGRKRAQLAQFEPRLWKPAANAREATIGYFAELLTSHEHVFLVAEMDATVCGFLLAGPMRVPPVYDAGPTAMIDDFYVSADELWSDVGSALLGAVRERLRNRGITQYMCLAPWGDSAKRDFLKSEGLSLHVGLFNGPV